MRKNGSKASQTHKVVLCSKKKNYAFTLSLLEEEEMNTLFISFSWIDMLFSKPRIPENWPLVATRETISLCPFMPRIYLLSSEPITRGQSFSLALPVWITQPQPDPSLSPGDLVTFSSPCTNERENGGGNACTVRTEPIRTHEQTVFFVRTDARSYRLTPS